MIEIIASLIFSLVIVYIMYRQSKDFDNTIRNILDQNESNTEKFYDMVEKIQKTHFDNLEKHTNKILKLLAEKPARVEEVKSLESVYPNEISKEEVGEDEFNENNVVPIVPGINLQFDGEEEIHPIEIT